MRVEDRVYRLEDLPELPDPTGPRLAVLGNPIHHSRSPQMHRAALDALAGKQPSFANWDYLRIEVEPERLGEFLKEAATFGFCGINLTVPHKEVVLPLLNHRDPVVERVGAANTLSLSGDGCIHGTNTDGYGLLAAMAEAFGFVPEGKRVLVLGAGGAARSAVDAILGGGAREVIVANRTLKRADRLVADLSHWFGRAGLRSVALEGVEGIASGMDAIIQASSAGLDPDAAAPFDVGRVSGNPILYEMIYGERPTALLAAARAAGWRTADGLGMLVYQGRRSLEIWTGEPVDPTIMRQAVDRENFGGREGIR